MEESTLPNLGVADALRITDILPSAASALGVEGYTNRLDLPSANSIVVVIADGLGALQLEAKAAHAPFIAKAWRRDARTALTTVPSTTASALTSFATGETPGQTGMVGYDVFAPEVGEVVNMLGHWDPRIDPLGWQKEPTVFERVNSMVHTWTVSKERFRDSPLTRAALRGTTFLSGESQHSRINHVVELTQRKGKNLIYLYWDSLDKIGHRFGVGSRQWVSELEELDSCLALLRRRVSGSVPVILSADHGMIDVPEQDRFDYSRQPELVKNVAHTGGEPRFVQLYLGVPEDDSRYGSRLLELQEAWAHAYGDRAWVATKTEAAAAGWFGPLSAQARRRVGDLLIAGREPVALYDMRRSESQSLSMVGQHGSLTDQEMVIPLVLI